MANIEDFLTQTDEQEIIEAIRSAEDQTSGEIRIHIEDSTKDDLYDRSMEVFHYLNMDNTEKRNGVLIYVAVGDHRFTIYGDEGINDVVADDFWDTTRDIMQNHFKQGNFKQGIIDGILTAGNELKKYFPWLPTDSDELSNEISRG